MILGKQIVFMEKLPRTLKLQAFDKAIYNIINIPKR